MREANGTESPKDVEVNSSNEGKAWSMLAHLSAYAGFFIPFGNILGPLVVYLAKRRDDSEVDVHGRASLNFQLTITLFAFVFFILIAVGVFLLALAGFNFAGSSSTSEKLMGQIGSLIVPVLLILVAGGLLVLLAVLDVVMVLINSIRAYDGKSPDYWPRIRFL
jgi:uncharacterized protein